jgi:hypothetical protein
MLADPVDPGGGKIYNTRYTIRFVYRTLYSEADQDKLHANLFGFLHFLPESIARVTLVLIPRPLPAPRITLPAVTRHCLDVL